MSAARRRAELEPGFVLHSYPYKETSLIVEAFTLRVGRVGLLARGARRPRSALRGVLLSFHPLRLSWSASVELGTLLAAEWSGGRGALGGFALMCGFYLNELLLRLLPREDPHEALFDAYAASLERLASGEDEAAVLRAFERRLLAELGYAPLLERDAASGAPVDPGRRYAYELDRGPVPVAAAAGGELVVSGQTLLDVARDDYARPQTRDEARALMRTLIAQRLGGQPLHTRSVLRELQEL
ncbi:MAG: DNA repair protein RecO [Betaproteobacteria bacterium]|nr:DNA repair protein RecO [Betaproteobacteria bacterium]